MLCFPKKLLLPLPLMGLLLLLGLSAEPILSQPAQAQQAINQLREPARPNRYEPASNAASSQENTNQEADSKEAPTTESTDKNSTAEETSPIVATPTGVSREAIQRRLEALESAGLDETEKRRATEAYQSALESLSIAEKQQEELQSLTEKFDRLPENIKKYRQELADPLPANPSIDPQADVAELERQATELEQTVKQTTESLAKYQAEPAIRTTRLAELPSLIADAKSELAELQEQTKATPVPADSTGASNLSLAKSLAGQARLQALQATLAVMEKQQQLYSTGGESLKLRQDLISRELAAQEKRLAKLREVINNRRQADATAQAANAARDAEKKRLPPIAALAKRNAELADLRKDASERIGKLTKEREEIAERNLTLKTEFERSQQRAEGTGLSEGMGQLLRQQQADLPDLQNVKRRSATRSQQAADVVFKQYELNDMRSDLSALDIEEQVEKVIAQLPKNYQTGKARERAEQEIRELLEAERKYLDDLIEDYDTYSLNLMQLGAEEATLIKRTEDYAAFIAKRVLWIRSCFPLASADVRPAVDASAWSLDPHHWSDAVTTLALSAREHPYQIGLLCLAMIVVLGAQRRSRRILREIGTQAAKGSCTNSFITVRAIWLTTTVALPWPVLMWFSGWWMDRPLQESEFVRSLSHGLRFTANCLFLLEFVRQLCRSGGLADAHFQWPSACLVQARRSLRWLTWGALPLVLWLVGLEVQNVEPLWSSSLGRVLFIIVMLLLSAVLRRVLLVRGSPLLLTMKQSGKTWLSLLHYLWGPLLVILPVLLAVLAGLGYYYTAQHMAVRLLQTVGVILGLLVVGGTLRRWILINRRKLAKESARKRREAQREQQQLAAAADTSTTSATPIQEIAEEVVDLKALGAQTDKLVHTVLMAIGAVIAVLIWQEMLSAVAFITEKPIFLTKGGTTWGQLLGFGLLVTVTWVAVRDLPALLDFAVLQHLPMDGGSRYAFTAICRYAILAVGIVAAFGALGFHWDSIQWLVAAMGVGLGFGMQEIFANFISGIILLFERPIRVGDIITLGDRTGVVNRIRMRATTIVDWDRKEYIVPNKDLITERLLNWTLTDHTNRIVIEVGVAYGSDTELACQLLREAAHEHPLILDEPAPVTTFDRFGDSALNLVLRCYLPNLDNRLDTIHRLHTMVDKKFRDAGLEIAFPQTDLHVRSVPKSVERLARREAEAETVASNGASNGST
ncbi:mechanosensitive ion channel domain-containing protein [Adhaeretor mobilis]|uniref:Miniconductance mechanosensitive channel MscM n=1 Tax=Adhaeretor mobilis TaxID=1930276 RepID=A0A517N2H3_9BACT|nr:mechanosensitive ion channel domain-containing protein [Adhaeretor mobilis]QDT01334.1 Miniconductance mechanosensitive channel MscM precursor [Adhaeretor mobilis]